MVLCLNQLGRSVDRVVDRSSILHRSRVIQNENQLQREVWPGRHELVGLPIVDHAVVLFNCEHLTFHALANGVSIAVAQAPVEADYEGSACLHIQDFYRWLALAFTLSLAFAFTLSFAFAFTFTFTLTLSFTFALTLAFSFAAPGEGKVGGQIGVVAGRDTYRQERRVVCGAQRFLKHRSSRPEQFGRGMAGRTVFLE